MAGTAYFDRAESLLKHASLYKTDKLAVFVYSNGFSYADRHPIRINAIYNYGDEKRHEAIWQPKFSNGWIEWVSLPKGLDDDHFIDFLENHVTDLLDAPATDNEDDVVFLRLAGTFDTDWISAKDLLEMVRTKKPEPRRWLFLVKLSPFEGGPLYRIPAKLSLNHKRLWNAELYSPHETIDFAFNDTLQKISEALGIEPFYGWPET